MEFYRERVVNLIDSMSFFGEPEREMAKFIYAQYNKYDIFPSNMAACCLLISEKYYGGNPKDKMVDILIHLSKGYSRNNKPKSGRTYFMNLRKKCSEIEKEVNLDECNKMVEVVFSGSKIGECEIHSVPQAE